MKKILFMVMFLILSLPSLFAQADPPDGYTTYYNFRMWAQGSKATADSLNANWQDIDAAIHSVAIDSTVTLPYYTTPFSSLEDNGLAWTTNGYVIYKNVPQTRVDTLVSYYLMKSYISGSEGSISSDANWEFSGDYIQVGNSSNPDAYISFYSGSNLPLPYFEASPYTGFTEHSIAYDSSGNFLFYDQKESDIERVMTWEDYEVETAVSTLSKHKFISAETWSAISGLSSETLVKIVVDCSDVTVGSIEVLKDGVVDYTVDASETSTRIISPSSSISLRSISETTDDISTLTCGNDSLDISAQSTTFYSMYFSPDGTKLFASGYANHYLYTYTLSSAFDFSSVTYTRSFNLNSYGYGVVRGIQFKPDGTKMFLQEAGENIYEFTLSTAWSTASTSLTHTLNIAARDNETRGLEFNDDGTKLFFVGQQHDSVYYYSLSSAYDLSSATYSLGFDVSGQNGYPSSVRFNSDGTNMYVFTQYTTTNEIFQYDLTTGYDLSTASYSTKSFDIESIEYSGTGCIGTNAAAFDICFGVGYTKLYVLNNGTNFDVDAVIYTLNASGNLTGTAYATVEK